ncbi:MAG: acyl--CoA ligase [Kutzneria sp.]|nr:acyl--CoA ligase [Kutzneria sp.]
MRTDKAEHGPLYGALRRHALTEPHRNAVIHDAGVPTYGELLHEVDVRAELISQQGSFWHILHDPPKVEFMLDYLATTKANTPVVISDGTTTAGSIASLLRENTEAVDSLVVAAPEVIFTSGSSAKAKAVLLDGHQMYRKALQINDFMGNSPEDVELITLPLRHSFGLGRLRCAVARGQTTRLVERIGSPDELFELTKPHAANGLAFIGSMAKILLSRHEGALAESAGRISYVEIGSEPLELEFRQALVRLLPDARLGMHYGMTELSRVAMVDLRQSTTGPAAAGQPMPEVEVRITDPSGAVEHTGRPGEIWVRGAAMLRAYVHEDGLRTVPRQTWLQTKDHGHVREDGALVVEGRLSTVLNILGKKVVPEETERVLRGLFPRLDCVCVPAELIPGVLILVAVLESPDTDRPDRAVLHSSLSERLPAHQIPRRFVYADRLPRLANGKVDRACAIDIASGREL